MPSLIVKGYLRGCLGDLNKNIKGPFCLGPTEELTQERDAEGLCMKPSFRFSYTINPRFIDIHYIQS